MDIAAEVQDGVTRRVLAEFYPRFAPHGRVVWVSERLGETAYGSGDWLRSLQLSDDALAELPNVMIRRARRNDFCLIDVARLGRQMTVRRRDRLLRILRPLRSALLFITAFENRKEFQRLVVDCPWGTVAWFADEPDHLVVFDDAAPIRLAPPGQ